MAARRAPDDTTGSASRFPPELLYRAAIELDSPSAIKGRALNNLGYLLSRQPEREEAAEQLYRAATVLAGHPYHRA